MAHFEVKDDGIYRVERTYNVTNCFSGEYGIEMSELIIPKETLIEALNIWGLIVSKPENNVIE